MSEPSNGKEKPAPDVVELRIVWNRATGQMEVSGCIHETPIALGLLKVCETLVRERWAVARATQQPRILPAEAFRLRKP